MELNQRFEFLNELNASLFEKDFLLTWEKSKDDIQMILGLADILKQMRGRNTATQVFNSGLAVSLFRDNSTRTRFSFSSAANLLGLEVQDLDEEKSQISHGETVRETAVMISFLSDIIGIRDDIFLGEGNKYMREVGEALDEAHSNGVLSHRPGIINLQCDIDHPTQTLADLLHLKNEFGSLEALKGKKMVMSWAYSPSYGKPLSVPQGIIGLMTRFGMDIEIAHPEEYTLLPEIYDLAHSNAKTSGGSFTVKHNMEEAIKDADIVYPKSWAPFSIMKKRTELLNDGNSKGLKELENEALKINAKYQDWEYNETLRKLTKDQDALYMHCLPADISGVSCKTGEVQAETFEKYRLKTYKEASYKPYIIAAMMLANKFKNPVSVLKELVDNNTSRIFS